MNKYCIGRIEGPWINFTPPIRGGVYGTDGAAEDEQDCGNWDSPEESAAASDSGYYSTSTAASVDFSLYHDQSKSVLLDPSEGTTSCDAGQRNRAQVQTTDLHLSTKAYTTLAIQGEINDDIRDYPSLDDKTQRAITQKYRALHQQVKDEGFYECRYQEYAKELVRYALLFASFLAALHYGWYLLSAVLLGLFWVGLHGFMCDRRHADRSSIKSCSQLMMPATEASPTISSPTH